MQKNKIVLFDIDYTLFDAYEYRIALIKKLAIVCSIKDTESFTLKTDQLYLQMREETGFEPSLFAKMLIEACNLSVSEEVLEQAMLEEGFIDSFIYPEAKEIFQQLSKMNNLTIGIFSGGRVDLQTKKIKNIRDFLHKDHVHIIRERKEDALRDVFQQYKNYQVYYVDDMLSILRTAKIDNPDIFTIWSKRGRFADKQQPIPGFQPDAQITHLKDLIQIIQTNPSKV